MSDFTQGELPWRTDFGSLLHVLRHQRNDAVLQELARVYVVDALISTNTPGDNVILAGEEQTVFV